MTKIFVDSDIILDLLLKRDPFFDDAFDLFFYIPRLKIKASTTALVLANVIYTAQNLHNKSRVIKRIQGLRNFLNVINIGEEDFDKALISNFTDVEDAMQYYAALHSKTNYIITRNKKDYKKSKIPVLNAKEFLSTMKVNQNV